MSYIQNRNWERWYKRCKNLAHELEAISKGIDATDIKNNRQISELAHLAGAYKYLRFAARDLHGGYLATEEIEFNEPLPEGSY